MRKLPTRDLNQRIIEASRAAGLTTLDASEDAYEKALKSLVDFEQKVASASQLDWVSALAGTYATFVATSAPLTRRQRATRSAEPPHLLGRAAASGGKDATWQGTGERHS